MSVVFKDGWFDRQFLLALNDLDMNSSVGCSAMKRFGTTVKGVLAGNTLIGVHSLDPERVAILKDLVACRLRGGDADPIRVFVKQEPHKWSKLRVGRYRLISAVSLTDTMVDRVMFGWLVRQILRSVGLTPILIGWSPVGPGSRLINNLFDGVTTRGLDKTAWDWTIQPWMLEELKNILKALAVGAPAFWLEWLDRRWEQLFRDAVFEFGDGSQVKQQGWGVMKSGCYLTIILNSIGQLLYHVMACSAVGITRRLKYVVIGDDVTVEDFPEFEAYERFIIDHGALLKPSEPSSVPEFAGFRFPVYNGCRVFEPEYLDKHVFKIQHTDVLELHDVLDTYQLLYAFNDDVLEWVQGLLRKLSPARVVSLRSLRFRVMR